MNIAEVRFLVRYLLLSGLVIGLACGLFVIRFGDRSLFGHLRSLGADDMDNVLAGFKAELDERLEELKEVNSERPKPKAREAKKKKPASSKAAPAKKKQQQKAPAKPAAHARPALSAAESRSNERQVARLEEASSLTSPEPKKAAVSKKTRVDERIPPRGLDKLLAKRDGDKR